MNTEQQSVNQNAKMLVSCECPFCNKKHKKVIPMSTICLDCSEYFNAHPQKIGDQLRFSDYIKGKRDDLGKAGEGYEALSELSKRCIDYAVDRYIVWIQAYNEQGTSTELDS